MSKFVLLEQRRRNSTAMISVRQNLRWNYERFCHIGGCPWLWNNGLVVARPVGLAHGRQTAMNGTELVGLLLSLALLVYLAIALLKPEWFA
jgi:K+-transporting ATPase KdpF subunit